MDSPSPEPVREDAGLDFIRAIVTADAKSG
jgi:hypothetical protein